MRVQETPHLPSERGLSLLEVTSTIVLLTSFALSVALLVVPVARQTRLNKEVNLANAEAQNFLEKIQATSFNNLLTDYPDSTNQTISNLPNGNILITYVDTDADPLLIQLDLSWDSPDSGSMRRAFFTARTE